MYTWHLDEILHPFTACHCVLGCIMYYVWCTYMHLFHYLRQYIISYSKYTKLFLPCSTKQRMCLFCYTVHMPNSRWQQMCLKPSAEMSWIYYQLKKKKKKQTKWQLDTTLVNQKTNRSSHPRYFIVNINQQRTKNLQIQHQKIWGFFFFTFFLIKRQPTHLSVFECYHIARLYYRSNLFMKILLTHQTLCI